MAKWLKLGVLTVLAEVQNLVPSIHVRFLGCNIVMKYQITSGLFKKKIPHPHNSIAMHTQLENKL